MWQNALIATASVLCGFIIWIFSQVDFLIPYKHLLIQQYGGRIALFLGLLTVNVFGGFFALTRRLLLKDTGRKLVHIEKQLRSGSVSRELSEQLNNE
jgi:hypothetical protein